MSFILPTLLSVHHKVSSPSHPMPPLCYSSQLYRGERPSKHGLQPLNPQALLALICSFGVFGRVLEAFLESLQLCEVRLLPLPPCEAILRMMSSGQGGSGLILFTN